MTEEEKDGKLTNVTVSPFPNAWVFATFGFLLYFRYRSTLNTTQNKRRLATIAKGWINNGTITSNPMVDAAKFLISQTVFGTHSLSSKDLLVDGDLVLTATVGLALSTYKHISTASVLLERCIRGNSRPIFTQYSRLLIVCELVKCYNILSYERKGELLATNYLIDYDGTPDTAGKPCLAIALADSLTGQQKFTGAEELLLELLGRLESPGYLTIATALRLSKIKRRIGREDEDLCSSSSMLWKAVEQLDHVDCTIKTDLAEEVTAVLL